MTKAAVQTEERAKEVINNFIAANNIEKGTWKHEESRCACGMTDTLIFYNEDVILKVMICDTCGDDGLSSIEVLEIA